MLRHPALQAMRLNMELNPIMGVLAQCEGNDPNVAVLDDGILLIGHYSGDILFFGGNDWERSYPEVEGLAPYGVCDTPEQFVEDFGEALRAHERTLTVTLTPVMKDLVSRGKGGGWRWHKWGPYVGKGEPTTEYLADEDGFDDGIHVYHVYDVTGLPLEPERPAAPDQEGRWNQI
jgi:hypothetical protein